MTWRLAHALVVLKRQIDEAFPGRDKSSDGTIGDASHQSHTSDHNPWVDGNVVTALDITNDPKHGVDARAIADMLRSSKDRRIKYIISDRRIANFQQIGQAPPFQWRPYYGAEPHIDHFHISVRPLKTLYDSLLLWNIALPKIETPPKPKACEPAPLIAAITAVNPNQP